ncbi:hypothetical protein ACTOVL_08240 [Arcanobacterium canis]
MIWWILGIGITTLSVYFVRSVRGVWHSGKRVVHSLSDFGASVAQTRTETRQEPDRGDARDRQACARAARERIRHERAIGRDRRLNNALVRWTQAQETFEKRTQ